MSSARGAAAATSRPLVSICCVTFNHEPFIKDAIDSFLIQDAPFAFEILIHDDASTDRTAQIVRAYEDAHPDKVRAIYQAENQYSKGVLATQFLFPQVRGKYVALCEGDDYWTDPHKLAMQVALMERHPEVRMSFHPAKQIDYSKNAEESTIGLYGSDTGIVPVEDIIARRCGMIPTASCMLTREAAEDVLRFTGARPYLSVGDIYIQIISSLPRGALFINRVMSAYRYLTPGSWTSAGKADRRSMLAHTRGRVRAMNELDEATGSRYARTFTEVNRKWLMRALRRPDDFMAGERLTFYREFRHLLRPLDRINLYPRLVIESALGRLKGRDAARFR